MAQALKIERGALPLQTSGRYRWIVCALLFFANDHQLHGSPDSVAAQADSRHADGVD
jgi:hypothetical protein